MRKPAPEERFNVLAMWTMDNAIVANEFPWFRFCRIAKKPQSYLACLRYSLKVFLGRRRFDLLFAGGLRLPICFALCNVVFRRRRIAIYAAVSVFLEVPSRNPLRRLVQSLKARILSQGVDKFMLISSEEIDLYHRVWGIPREKMQLIQFKIIDEKKLAVLPRAEEPYLFTGGNSERDYLSFFAAVRGLDIPVKVLSTLNFSAYDIPDNVRIIDNDGSTEAFYGPMALARLVVIPLRGGQLRSSGQGTYLSAMALGKALIVSGVAGTRDLIEDGETAVLVEPGNSEELRKAIIELWNDQDRSREIGLRAEQLVTRRNTHDRYLRTHLINMTEICMTARGRSG